MTYMTADEFYQANIDKEKEYVRTYAAYEVKGGEKVVIGSVRRVVVPLLDGYMFDHNDEILSNAEFAAKTTSAEDLELPLAKEELPEEIRRSIKPIRKGELFVFGPRTMSVPHDGFTVMQDGLEGFTTNLQLTSRFNYAGEKYVSEKETIVTMNDAKPVRGIILEEQTTLVFNHAPVTIPRGYLISRDPAAENGYLIVHDATGTELRLSPNSPSPHKTAAERQKKLKALAHPKQQ